MKPNMGEARRGGRLWAETAYARTASMWQLLNLPDETRQSVHDPEAAHPHPPYTPARSLNPLGDTPVTRAKTREK